MRRLFIPFTLLLVIAAAGCSLFSPDDGYREVSGLSMGTTFHVKLKPVSIQDTGRIQEDIRNILEQVDASMSTYRPDSELSRVNRAERGVPVNISDDLALVMIQALEISVFTGGMFDVTAGPLVNLWGFGPQGRTGTVPSDRTIRETLRQVGYQQVSLSMAPFSITRLQDGVYIDLSGIAKGFAVDQLAAYLEGRGIENYLVEIGGEIKSRGVNAGGVPWRIGIEKPVTQTREVERVIHLDNMALATSGDYRNFFEIDGKRYSHVINPRTGYPVAHDLVSVSVADKSATWADAIATALLVMGPAAGPDFASRQHIPAMFVSRDGVNFRESYTAGFDSFLLE